MTKSKQLPYLGYSKLDQKYKNNYISLDLELRFKRALIERIFFAKTKKLYQISTLECWN